MGYATILVRKRNQIARITLNRPAALNALNDKMGEEFYTALKDAEKDEDTRCLIITGAGRAFSAGEDVSGLKERYGGESILPSGIILGRNTTRLSSESDTWRSPSSGESTA